MYVGHAKSKAVRLAELKVRRHTNYQVHYLHITSGPWFAFAVQFFLPCHWPFFVDLFQVVNLIVL